MNECVTRMVNDLEPLIMDLDEKLSELKLKKERQENVSRFLAYVNGDVNLVGIYADQNFIIDNLENVDSNKDEYKASCYLLKSDDSFVKSLPQYRDANLFILKLINYFKANKSDLLSEIQELENVCEDKKKNKKYYEIFKGNNPFVEDVHEFEEFLKKREMPDNDMIDILTYVLKSNVHYYESKEN